MSVNLENRDVDDEEDGRVTPKRINSNDIPVANSTESENRMQISPALETSTGQDSVKSETLNHTDLRIYSLLASLSSISNVVMKDEPPDSANPHSESPSDGESANREDNAIIQTAQALETSTGQDSLISDLRVDALLASLSSLPNVLTKDEPPDSTNLHSEGPDDGVSSPWCIIKSEENCFPPQDGTENRTCTNNEDKFVEPPLTESPIEKNTAIQTHPQIRLASTYRLRVKQEFSEKSSPGRDVNTEIAKDLYEGQNLLPENFFDDLLVDRVQERVEEAENEELEEKYSDRLKLLQQLERINKEKKKHKKSKKKSRKRSRSRSRERDDQSATTNLYKSKRSLEECKEMASTLKRSRYSNTKEHSKVIDIADASKKAYSLMDLDEEAHVLTENHETIDPHLPEIGPHLTARQKRDRILIRAKLLFSYLKRIENAKELPFTKFVHTSTVRKLPASYSYRHQHIYENRSPLHTINNVKYKFNSHISEFNFEEWGLASLPPLSAKMAKLLGYDAATLHNKLKDIKIPAKLKNIKSEDQINEEDELLQQTRLSLYCNATTQTEENIEYNIRKPKGYDIGVQCKPTSLEMACQTLETEAPSIKQFDNEDELPIMAIMRQLNENQLMALHDFAELLTEPTTNAMDMYRLRQRMLEIYKSSQTPSALPPLISVPGNSYTSNESYSAIRYQKQQEQQNHDSAFRIETVSSADGRRIMVNDPRRQRNEKETTNRGIRNEIHISRANGNFNPRPSSSSYSHFQNQPPANVGNKYYGRGGLRR